MGWKSCAAAMPFLIAASSAHADDAATEKDIRCLIVYINMGSSDDPGLRTAGLMGSFYWFGRVDGDAPGLDLENRVLADLTSMTSADYQAEALRCGAEMASRGDAMKQMGRHLMEKGRELELMEKSR